MVNARVQYCELASVVKSWYSHLKLVTSSPQNINFDFVSLKITYYVQSLHVQTVN